jgi:hypothetical protein
LNKDLFLDDECEAGFTGGRTAQTAW